MRNIDHLTENEKVKNIPNEKKNEEEITTIRMTPRVYSEFLVRTRRVRDNYEINTKGTIENALQNLKELVDEAHKRATSKNLPTNVRQKWMRIEIHICQAINTLTKNYDNQWAAEKLKELTLLVEKYMEKDPESGEED